MSELKRRTVGPVTGASAVGGSLGAAIGQLIVHFFPTLQPVEASVTVIITAVLSVIGGYLVPPKDDTEPLTLDDYHDHDAPGAHAE
ncbi:MAG: hypothetical protein HLX51_02675 [Micrococcaceae bacterium]|nr:hypothetical protein [Micrococcaceae bacterium]